MLAHNLVLLRIHVHTLQQPGATIWYHLGIDLKTRQERFGHRNIIHTFRYVHFADGYFPEITERYYTGVTLTIHEGEKLVQQDFELIGKDESGCLWRKPKTFEDVVREREQELGVKNENSSEKIL